MKYIKFYLVIVAFLCLSPTTHAQQKIKVLNFQADNGFQHKSKKAGLEMIEQLGELNNWEVVTSIDTADITMKKMQSFDVIVFNNNCGNKGRIFSDAQKDIAICEFAYKAGSWEKARILKAIRTVKEYVETDFFRESKIVPVYQYACYISTYELDAAGLHKIYKQRSTSETWIEQVKGHVMAGATLTGDFWANDILWQLSVFAYNISVMMRQKKDKFKRQEHRTFIDWFISVPTKITSTGHQMELKLCEHHFNKADWQELDRVDEAE